MAEIKISELSIGDWVRYDEGSTPYTIRSIVRTGEQECVVLNDSCYPDGITVFVDMLKPIPLTPEILEKNGFVSPYNNESYMYDDGGKHRVYIRRQGEVWKFEHTLWGFGSVRNDMRCEVAFVLQLQHALRLAGVGKEIEV